MALLNQKIFRRLLNPHESKNQRKFDYFIGLLLLGFGAYMYVTEKQWNWLVVGGAAMFLAHYPPSKYFNEIFKKHFIKAEK